MIKPDPISVRNGHFTGTAFTAVPVFLCADYPPLHKGRCPKDTGVIPLPKGRCPKDTGVIPLPKGRCPKDTGVIPLHKGRCPKDTGVTGNKKTTDACASVVLTGNSPEAAAFRVSRQQQVYFPIPGAATCSSADGKQRRRCGKSSRQTWQTRYPAHPDPS